MFEDLHTYVRDHIAGATAASDAISLLMQNSSEAAVVQLLRKLEFEVREDKAALEELSASLSIHPSSVKDSAAWFSARLVSLKVHGGKTSFGAFEGLEFLALAIQGKLHLWQALQRSTACEATPNGPDYEALIRRAETQHAAVEEVRLGLASRVL